ncbi:hypothetical protein YC2023_080054 [Brassica napus]
MNTGQDEEPLPSTETRKKTRRSSADGEEETNIYNGSNRRVNTGGSTNRRKNVDAYHRSYPFNYLACIDPTFL